MLFFICILLLLSCSASGGIVLGRYGKIIPDREAKVSFESYVVNDDFNYYISGPDSYPIAIIGVDKGYFLVSDLWKKRYLTSDMLKRLVLNMQSAAWEYRLMMHGFNIMDDRGNDIGDWYSILSAKTSVKMVGEKKIVINTPPIDTYEKFRMEVKDWD
jgi:hypothetical protein